MSSTGTTATTRPVLSDMRPALVPMLAVGLGLVILGVAFAREIAAAVGVWESSTAYGHCFLVLPIALYLGWERRAKIAATPIVPMPSALLLMLPAGAAWFVAERLGIMEGRQLVALGLLQIMVLAVLGWRMWWAISVPLLYLFFLIPFGAFITPALQDFTTGFIRVGLAVLGVPAYIDSYNITIPEGSFVVAEACAGLRFLIASIAFGVLFAFVIYRSPWRRVAFIAVSLLLPVVANGFRALGIVVLGHLLGSAEAAATDHVLYGWMFFSVVILLLIAVGMLFREDHATPLATPHFGPVPERRRSGPRMVGAALAAGVLALAGPLAARAVDATAGTAPRFTWPELATPEGCSAAAPVNTQDVAAPSAFAMAQRITCGDTAISVRLETLPPRANPGLLAVTQRHADGEDAAEDTTFSTLVVPGVDPPRWQWANTQDPARVTASVLWIDGRPSGVGLRGRATQALAGMRGVAVAPVLMAVSGTFAARNVSDETRAPVMAAITRYIAAQHNLPAAIAQVRSGR
ncbi:MAG: exosortase [Acetobacteraceae bacterium]|nr:exosortase [Acetobacteraceae bacterium]